MQKRCLLLELAAYRIVKIQFVWESRKTQFCKGSHTGCKQSCLRLRVSMFRSQHFFSPNLPTIVPEKPIIGYNIHMIKSWLSLQRYQIWAQSTNSLFSQCLQLFDLKQQMGACPVPSFNPGQSSWDTWLITPTFPFTKLKIAQAFPNCVLTTVKGGKGTALCKLQKSEVSQVSQTGIVEAHSFTAHVIFSLLHSRFQCRHAMLLPTNGC